jgi:pyrroline-5-carboxylate reductase
MKKEPKKTDSKKITTKIAESPSRPADFSRIAILGGGNIGQSMARGLVVSKKYTPDQITITRRQIRFLDSFKSDGYEVTEDNRAAVSAAGIIVLAVRPLQLPGLLQEIREVLDPQKHLVISVVTDAWIRDIQREIGKNVPVIRAMPNIAISIGESMTCLSAEPQNRQFLKIAEDLFNLVGKALVIEEEYMIPATALCACGVAFFLRSIRAAAQGGIEIGFHAEDAIMIAAQTAKGAASIILNSGSHPETEIDKVTTPRGCTIAGLNQMEHQGFSSAMIKGIITSAEKAAQLFTHNEK